MRAHTLCVVLAGALLLAPLAGADDGTRFVDHVKRTLASPTPIGPFAVLGDTASYALVIPLGTTVCVSATESGAALFWLRATNGATTLSSPVPSMAQGLILGPGSWTVTVDPALGARVDITIVFEGHYVDCGNDLASFSLSALPSTPPCAEGACLP